MRSKAKGRGEAKGRKGIGRVTGREEELKEREDEEEKMETYGEIGEDTPRGERKREEESEKREERGERQRRGERTRGGGNYKNAFPSSGLQFSCNRK